jgi:hypothetical protein
VSGVTDALDEFVELFNAGTCPVVLDGWSIRYMSAKGLAGYRYWAPPPSGRRVEPGTFFVIASVRYTGASKDDDAMTSRGLAEKGALGLFFGDRRVDSVAWGDVVVEQGYVETEAAGAVPRGQSLVRRVDGGDTNRNAIDFRAGVPTPGRSNRGP